MKKANQTTVQLDSDQQTSAIKAIQLSEAIAMAQYNDAGVAMTPLGAYDIGGQQVDVLLVSMRPGVSVPVHIHQHGGESQMPLTPVRGIFGTPRKDSDGEYVFNEDGQVLFEVVEDRTLLPNEIISIPADFVHGYSNPSQEDEAHIVFNLPHAHTTAEDKLLADTTLNKQPA